MAYESDVKVLIELQRRADKLKGKEIALRLLNLRPSYYVLRRDHEELLSVNASHMKDWSIVELGNAYSEKLEKYLLEFSRCFQHYLASFSAMIGGFQSFRNHLKDTQLSQLYDAKLKEQDFVEDLKFTRDLRNYALHYKLPIVSAPLDRLFTTEGLTSGVPAGVIKGDLSLRTEDLLQWKDLPTKSRKYLERQKKSISHSQGSLENVSIRLHVSASGFRPKSIAGIERNSRNFMKFRYK